MVLCGGGLGSSKREGKGAGLVPLQEGKFHTCPCAWISTEYAPSSMVGRNWALDNPLGRQLYLGNGSGGGSF